MREVLVGDGGIGEGRMGTKRGGSYFDLESRTFTYDHRLKKTGHPVRSAIHKLEIGRLVVGWVTTSESLLSYVFWVFFRGSLFDASIVWLHFSYYLPCNEKSLVPYTSP